MANLVGLEDQLDVNLKRIDEELEGDDTTKEIKYLEVLDYLNSTKFCYGEVGIPVPLKLDELRRKAHIIGAKQELIEAKTELKEKHFGRALNDLDRVKRYSNEAGIQVPKEVDGLIKTASKMGIGYHLTSAQKAFEGGDYSQARCDLGWAESYSKIAGIQVPGKVAELRNRITAFRYKEA